jgi:zinc transporter ZupT
MIAVLCLLLAVWLLANSTLREAIQATIAAAAGLFIYLTYRMVRYNFRRANDANEL